MKITDLTKETEELTTKDKVLEIAKSLKQGQGIPIAEVAKDIGVNVNNIRTHARILGCYVVKYIGGKQIAFVTNITK